MALLTALLTLTVLLVNGWTDAPNAIATCVSTRALTLRRAVLLAAVFNLIGALAMTLINRSVAATVYQMADFGKEPHTASLVLCAAMAAVVLWAVLAWFFGIPTSESHALLAALSGAALALQGTDASLRTDAWSKVVIGLFCSTFLGFFVGTLLCKTVILLFRHLPRSRRFFVGAQALSAAGMSFMHGAQDGQKFLAVFLLGMTFSSGQSARFFSAPLWLILLCSLVMALGTAVGGKRIIKSVGVDMVKLKPYQGFAADLAASLCLLFCSLCGLPVSTTHTKTCAVMGAGAAQSVRRINWRIVKELVLTWLFTFPGCGLLGFVLATLFLYIF